MEQLLAGGTWADRDIAVAFAPIDGRVQPAQGQGVDDVAEKPGLGPADVAAENQRRRAEGARTISLPIRASGLEPGSRLLADRSEVTLSDRGGVVFRGRGNDLELHATNA